MAVDRVLILGGVWIVFTAIGWVKYRALRWSAVAPVLVVVTAALVMFSIPPTFAFAVSERSLSTAANHCTQSFADTTRGVYRVYQVQPVDGGCLFFIEGGLFQSIGLAYFPDRAPDLHEPRREGDIGYEEFDGDSYQFEQLW